jgi:hypothetical protein|tara:strand:+ start:4517 stop:4744 length:228 start_codon:yes stop_codon:yes gene_type:complete
LACEQHEAAYFADDFAYFADDFAHSAWGHANLYYSDDADAVAACGSDAVVDCGSDAVVACGSDEKNDVYALVQYE